ncbi:MAG: hypothetical protein M3O06_12200 [Pseudomonadota bacterium]|nr:hypothetical protein [Pseudomonadota bacterium]
MTVVPFQPFHLEILRAQGIQAAQVSHVPATYAKFQRPPGPALTVFHGEQVILCGGIVTVGSGMGILWAVLSKNAGRHMVWLHRATQRFLQLQELRRIEATVEAGFAAGCRWIELLGFKFEGDMPGYGDNGETHLRYGLT